MKIIRITTLILLVAGLFSSCLTTKQTNLLKDPGGDIPHYPKVEAIGEYQIKPGDELLVQITSAGFDTRTEQLFSLFSSKNNSSNQSSDNRTKLRTLTVDPDGTVYFPYLGLIPVKDMTTSEIKQLLEDRLNKEITESCFVEVYLENRYFSVIGESRVGRYPIAKEQMTIYQALAQSQDINPYGDRSKVKIIRQTDSGTVVKTFDIRSKDIINSEFYYIQPNDVIYIQPLGRQFWGIDSFGAIFAIISTVASIGLVIYNFSK